MSWSPMAWRRHFRFEVVWYFYSKSSVCVLEGQKGLNTDKQQW